MIAKSLRRHGVDVELVINGNDFGMAFPQWEEAKIEGLDPYTATISALAKSYPLPEWVKVWGSAGLHIDPLRMVDLMRMSREYDLLQFSPPSVVYLQFLGKPFIVHESGWIRHFPYLNGATEKLARRGYARAECVVMTNPDCYRILAHVKHRGSEFIPFIVEPDRYKPISVPKNDRLIFFHPARHTWDIKGNDIALRGFAGFIKKDYDAKLILVDWGTTEDSKRSKQLIKALGIEQHVKWIQPLSKPDLIRMYNQADAVLDQFVLGSYGTLCPESLACACPVIMYLNEYWNNYAYGETAPVLNSRTPEQVTDAMVMLTDPVARRKYGEAGRKYVLRHHDPDTIAKQYMTLYQEILEA